jgi:hypothetical protein
MIDTYINNDHTLRRAAERVGENTARSTQRDFRQDRVIRPAEEEDEAAALMARLEALKK